MILYFLDRTFTVLGSRGGECVAEDRTTENVKTGQLSFFASIRYQGKRRAAIETLTQPGNYLIVKRRGHNAEVYTITDTEQLVRERSIDIYAEDVGLDLINDIAPAYTAAGPLGIADYIEMYTLGSGFALRINEVADLTRTLEWEGDSTVAERLASIANSFGAEISYSFDVRGMTLVGMYIDVYKQRGRADPLVLTVGREIQELRVRRSVADLATAIKPTGRDGLTLSGVTYDDGDIYYDAGADLLISRSAYARWCRAWVPGQALRQISRPYEVDTASQTVLLSQAVRKLNQIKDMTVKYEADQNRLPSGMAPGDAAVILDRGSGLRLTTRLVEIKESETGKRSDAVFDELKEF